MHTVIIPQTTHCQELFANFADQPVLSYYYLCRYQLLVENSFCSVEKHVIMSVCTPYAPPSLKNATTVTFHALKASVGMFFQIQKGFAIARGGATNPRGRNYLPGKNLYSRTFSICKEVTKPYFFSLCIRILVLSLVWAKVHKMSVVATKSPTLI